MTEEGELEVQLQELRLNGYVLFEGMFPVELVDAMREQLRPLLDSEYRRALADGWKRGRGPGRLGLHLDRYIELTGEPLRHDRYLANPWIETLVERVFDAPWSRYWALVEAVWKGSVFMPWHADRSPNDPPGNPSSSDRLIFNIPLVDFSVENGAIEVVPGSHNRPPSFDDGPRVEELSPTHAVHLLLRRGDAVLRDGRMLHRGTPNRTDTVRPMLDRTYKKAREGAARR